MTRREDEREEERNGAVTPAAALPAPGEATAGRAGEGGDGARLAKPRVVRMRWPFPLIWIVPVAAAVAAGIYLYEYRKERGREIVIDFVDADGVRAEETWVNMRGAQVGVVTAIAIAPDHRHAEVHVRLHGSDDSIGRSGARFWIVKPDVTDGGIRGLGTIVSGAYIEARPGEGTEQSHFTGEEGPPLIRGEGMKLILHAERLEKLQEGSAVEYRGIPVGVVQDIRLSSDATNVNVTVFIFGRYRPLVRTNSRFWLISGADVKGNVFTGMHAKIGSVQALISGRVGLATPDEPGKQVGEGEEYVLNAEAKDEWLRWAPKIELAAEEGDGGDGAGAGR